MHLCGRGPSLQGLTGRSCSLAFGHNGLYPGLAVTIPRSGGRRALPTPPSPHPPSRHCSPSLASRPAGVFLGPLQALASQSFPLHGARAGEGVCSSAHGPLAPLTHASSWLGQVSPGHRMAPEGSAVNHLHLKGSTGTTGQMPPGNCHPGLQKDESCNLLLLLPPRRPSPLPLC